MAFTWPFEAGEIGPDLFRHACLMGLEGLVSKHRESSYRAAGSTAQSRLKIGAMLVSAGNRRICLSY
jgi:bifunctional non-homologous end joining protein LigD